MISKKLLQLASSSLKNGRQSHRRPTGLRPIPRTESFRREKTGVKGLADGGITKIPRIFIQRPPDQYSPNPATQNPIFPLINLESIREDPVKRKKVIEEVRVASETWGFFQVINHGICHGISHEMLDGVRRFYEQDDEVKKEWYTRDLSKKVIYNSNFDLFSAPSANWRDTVYCQMAPNAPKHEELPQVCSRTEEILIDHLAAERRSNLFCFRVGDFDPTILHQAMS